MQKKNQQARDFLNHCDIQLFQALLFTRPCGKSRQLPTMVSKTSRLIRIREYALEPSSSEASSQPSSFVEFELELFHGDDDSKATVGKRNYHAFATASGNHPQQSILNLLKSPYIRSKTIIQDLLLPIGYPSSVADGYMEYQFYDSLQGLCSYLRGVLCSAQVLQAAGVGTAEATAMSAAMTWALKDGAALIGGLVFSYQVSSVLDSHVKEFRFFADLINNVGLTLDMLAPYFGKNHLLLVSSCAGLCKTLCGLSAGATKSSLTQHFAIDGNMADVTAKESTQETFVSLLGMLLGVGLAHRLQVLQTTVGGHDEWRIQQIQWVIFLALTVLHIWSNYKGVALLRLRTLNRERAEVVLGKVVQSIAESVSLSVNDKDSTTAIAAAVQSLPPPDMVIESLLSSTFKMLHPGRLLLDSSLADMIALDPFLVDDFRNERYAMTANHDKGTVMVCLFVGATCQDQLKALVHALVMIQWMTRNKERVAVSKDAVTNASRQVYKQLNKLLFPVQLAASETTVSSLMDELISKGWDVDHRLLVGFSRRRFSLILKDD